MYESIHSHPSPSTLPRGSADAKRDASECAPYMNGWSSAAMRRRRAARLACETAGWSGGAVGGRCVCECVCTDGGDEGSKKRPRARPLELQRSHRACPRTPARDPLLPLHPTAPLCPAHAHAGPRRAPCPRHGGGAAAAANGCLVQWLVVDPAAVDPAAARRHPSPPPAPHTPLPPPHRTPPPIGRSEFSPSPRCTRPAGTHTHHVQPASTRCCWTRQPRARSRGRVARGRPAVPPRRLLALRRALGEGGEGCVGGAR